MKTRILTWFNTKPTLAEIQNAYALFPASQFEIGDWTWKRDTAHNRFTGEAHNWTLFELLIEKGLVQEYDWGSQKPVE